MTSAIIIEDNFLGAPFVSLAATKAFDYTGVIDGVEFAYVGSGKFVWSTTSTAVADDINVIIPNNIIAPAPGRLLRITPDSCLMDSSNRFTNAMMPPTPSFTSVTLSGLTASRLLATDGSKVTASTSISSWLSGTANEITVTNNGDGTATLSTPQAIDTAANVVFNAMKLNGLTGNTLMCVDSGKQVQSVTIGNGISFTTTTISANINTTNLQFTANQINTIQNITTSSSPQFSTILLGSGAVGAVAVGVGATTTGLYSSAANTLDISTNGANRVSISTTSMAINHLVTTTGRVQVGSTTNTGGVKLQTTSSTAGDGYLALCTAADASDGGGAVFVVQNSGAAVTSGTRLGAIYGGGATTNAPAYNFIAGQMAIVSTETWNAGATGCRFDFFTTNNGGTTRSIKMRIDNDGTISLGATSTTPTHIINGATNSSATAGSASALPALPAGYWTITFNGTTAKIPYYAN